MIKLVIVSLLAASSAIPLGPARGMETDESPFASIYVTTLPRPGEVEGEQWLTSASSKPNERFDEVEGRDEVEYGVNNKLLLSLYANYRRTRVAPFGPGAPDRQTDTTRFTGFSAEAIYQVLNPDTGLFGFALYLEPSIGAGERAFEGKLLFQRDFLDDRLILAANANLEYVWAHNVAAGRWDRESALEFYLGASYRFTQRWYAGVEFLNENAYSGHILGGAHAQSNAFYAGPALHYAGWGWWATLAAYGQLPWAGNPAHAPGAISHGLLAGAERLRLRLRVGVDLS
jgi:hypothetical protein